MAEELKSQHFIDLVIIGGVLERSLMGMAGPLELEGIRKFKFDKAVIGIGGLSVKHGLTTRDIAEAEIKRAVIGASQSIMIPAGDSETGVNSPSVSRRYSDNRGSRPGDNKRDRSRGSKGGTGL